MYKVFVRFRPHNRLELERRGNDQGKYQLVIDKTSNEKVDIIRPEFGWNKSFKFSRVFDEDDDQETVFNFTSRGVADDFLDGRNCAILSYGQTGAGKKHTMYGRNEELDGEGSGIISRSAEQIFRRISESPSSTDFKVTISYVQIYCERVRDLLTEPGRLSDNLKVRMNRKTKLPHIENLTKIYVTTSEEVKQCLKQGRTNIVNRSLTMGSRTSRSHEMIFIELERKDRFFDPITSKLCFVKLAGSERIRKTGAMGHRLEEAKKISMSLSSLGLCINSIYKKRRHIPYRNSRLTWILQEFLHVDEKSDNCCYFIINCSKHQYNMEETIASMRFGQRVVCCSTESLEGKRKRIVRRWRRISRDDLIVRTEFLFNEENVMRMYWIDINFKKTGMKMCIPKCVL